MNITIISNILPYPLSSGGAQAQYNMIDILRKEHNISFIFTHEMRNSLKSMRHLQEIWPKVRFVPFLYVRQMLYPPFLKAKARRAFGIIFRRHSTRFFAERMLQPYGVCFSRDFIGFVNHHLIKTKCEIVQVEFFPSLHIVNYLPQNVKKVYVQHEIRFVRNDRLFKDITLTASEAKLKDRVRQQEIDDMNKYDAVITLTNIDRNTLEDNGVTSRIQVSPAAVNSRQLPYKEWNGKLLFIGGYGHMPNKEGVDWFISSVAPLLSAKDRLGLDIFGTHWDTSYQNNKTIDITLRGFVPDIAMASGYILIVPLLTGSGMRMKILEGAAMCLPIITTTVGVEGLDFKHKESCLIADTPQEFAEAIHLLRTNEDLRKELAFNAQEIFKSQYSRQALAKVRDEIYKQL